MSALKRHLAEWPVWVLSYVVAYQIMFWGTALSIYLWAASFDDWGTIFRTLFWRSFLGAIPLGLILGFAWRRTRARRGG